MTRSERRSRCVSSVITLFNSVGFEWFYPKDVSDILPYGFYSRLIREGVLVRDGLGWALSSDALVWIQRNRSHDKDDISIDSKKIL